jgi:hypothetical protein
MNPSACDQSHDTIGRRIPGGSKRRRLALTHRGAWHLFGNGLECRCRVEITTLTSQGRPHVRQLDIWVGESLPAGEYRLVMNGETLLMHYSKSLWHEIIDRLPPARG